MSSAKFISIEGGEGGGKTTNLELMKEILSQNNIPFIVTREPGGTPLAEELRALLLENRDEKVNPVAELLMMFAARAQHVETVIKPALAAGKWVISDRFTDASFAYQGGGRNIDWAMIESLEALAIKSFKPDKTFLFDLDPVTGMKRAASRSEYDRFENEQMDFFKKVRQAYHRRMDEQPSRFILIDASKPLDEVKLQVKQSLELIISSAINEQKKEFSS
ncbi:MAG: dTMP kinase [Gammaproteobacteria bacterium]|nr:dTMP kinase [Gammaproteobacteria bacterium]